MCGTGGSGVGRMELLEGRAVALLLDACRRGALAVVQGEALDAVEEVERHALDGRLVDRGPAAVLAGAAVVDLEAGLGRQLAQRVRVRARPPLARRILREGARAERDHRPQVVNGVVDTR